MTHWMLNKRTRLAETQHMTLVQDTATSPSDKQIEYTHLKIQDGVMIVPIKLFAGEVSFILTSQYRYPTGKVSLEFPGGAVAPNEPTEASALRELLEETGYTSNKIKFIYVMDTISPLSSAKTYVYSAVVEGEPAPLQIEESEKDFGLTTRECSADQVLKLLRDNEITDSRTVAALSAVLLQSPKAIEYADSLSGD